MKKSILLLLSLIMLIAGCNSMVVSSLSPKALSATPAQSPVIKLPEPKLDSKVSVEQSLLKRRSVREFKDSSLSIGDVSQLLWAAQGITSSEGGRTAPSAGGLYPIEVYLAAGQVEDLNPAVYKYQPKGHTLIKVKDGDIREDLSQASLGQAPIKYGAIDIIIAAVYERTTAKYGDRGIRYAILETGHVAQNLYLESTAIDLGMVTIGAFDDEQVRKVVGIPENETPLYVVPVGKKK